MYELTENLDLSGIVTGYLKSVEQLLLSLIKLHSDRQFKIKSKHGGLVEFTADNDTIIDTTLWALEQVIRHNGYWMLDVNPYVREFMLKQIDDWREKHRNGYFHKHNLQSIDKVKEIRNTAIQLYFLILGSFSIKEDQFEALGIYE